MIVRGAVKDVLSGHNMDHLNSDAELIIVDSCRDRLANAGVYIEQLVLEDFAITRPFRLFNNGGE